MDHGEKRPAPGLFSTHVPLVWIPLVVPRLFWGKLVASCP